MTHKPPARPLKPLTDEEKALIQQFRAAGLGVMLIQRKLKTLGYRRGTDKIQDYLNECAFPPFQERRKPNENNTHKCVFCDWCGPSADYYGHWRTQHRRRAGHTPAEITRESHRHV